ncbi:3230_t:CDS:2, partial [Gigaspora rosea]
MAGAFPLSRAFVPTFHQDFASVWLRVEVVPAPFFFSKGLVTKTPALLQVLLDATRDLAFRQGIMIMK